MEIKYDENADKYSLSEKVKDSTGNISVAEDQSGRHSDKLRGLTMIKYENRLKKSLHSLTWEVLGVCMSLMTYFYHCSLSEQCAWFGRLYCTLLENLAIVAWICDLYFFCTYIRLSLSTGSEQSQYS